MLTRKAVISVNIASVVFPPSCCPSRGQFHVSSHVRKSEFWNPGFEILLLESGIELNESGIQNPSSPDKVLNPVPGIGNPRQGM